MRGGVTHPGRSGTVRPRPLLSAVLALATSAAAASVLALAPSAAAAPGSGGASTSARGGSQQSGDSGPAVYQDVSKPLRDMPPKAGPRSKNPVEDMEGMPQTQTGS